MSDDGDDDDGDGADDDDDDDDDGDGTHHLKNKYHVSYEHISHFFNGYLIMMMNYDITLIVIDTIIDNDKSTNMTCNDNYAPGN